MSLRGAGSFLGGLAPSLPEQPRLNSLVLQPLDPTDITEPSYFNSCILRKRKFPGLAEGTRQGKWLLSQRPESL